MKTKVMLRCAVATAVGVRLTSQREWQPAF